MPLLRLHLSNLLLLQLQCLQASSM